MTTAERLARAKTDVDEVYEAGIKYPWKHVTTLSNTFNDANFPEGSELVLYVPEFNKDMSYAFYSSTGLRKVTFIGDYQSLVTFSLAFRGSDLEEIDFSGFGKNGYVTPGNFKNAFQECRKLKVINGVFDMSSLGDITTAFTACSLLEEIRIKEKTLSKPLSFAPCKSLSEASINSIINGLSDLTGQSAQIISFHTDILEQLTETQIGSIWNKNWTLD
jgi:hypothetical protein